jgi:hypothetical protein
MRLMTRMMFGAAALALLVAVPVSAQERLRPIGEVVFVPRPAEPQSGTFDLRPEQRMISVMRIAVDEGAAEIRELRLIYRNGEEQSVRVRERVRSGQTTSIIRLQEPRPLRQIIVSYVPDGKTRLVLRADYREPVEPPKPQWVEIGCQTAGFLLDRDVLDVKSKDSFRSLRLRGSGFDADVNELSVRYANGVRDVYPLRVIIPAGSVTGPIDLRGQNRQISQIEIIHRSRVLSNQKAQVCIEGLRRPAVEE